MAPGVSTVDSIVAAGLRWVGEAVTNAWGLTPPGIGARMSESVHAATKNGDSSNQRAVGFLAMTNPFTVERQVRGFIVLLPVEGFWDGD